MYKGLITALVFTVCFPWSAFSSAIPVTIVEDSGKFALHRGGQPYYIRGAGGSESLQRLNATGGNSVRIWGEADRDFLDKAHAAGLSVCVGLWVEHERHGFDYDDPAVMRAQIDEHCAVIDELMDHPAVLLWGIGNEVELQSTNPKVWDVVEAIAAHAKKVDPNHPTMTVVAHAPEEAVHMILQRAPSIDILGCNSYEGILALAGDVRKAGWNGPYIVTEWGTSGMWEVDHTAWGAEIEATSTVKAQQILDRYSFIRGDRDRCLGSYVFLWGSKQETTPTWFNLFMDSGESTEAVDSLQYLWTGQLPDVEAPRIQNLQLNKSNPEQSLVVKANRQVNADFSLLNRDLSQVDLEWHLLAESTDKKLGGDREQKPGEIPLQSLCSDGTRFSFFAPSQPGNYRLYLYVHGHQSKVATANFPFQVAPPLPSPHCLPTIP